MARKASVTKGKSCAMALLATASLALVGCKPATPVQRPPEPGDAAVARVNGQVIWASDVKREAAAEGLIGQGDPLDPSSDLFRQALDEVIDTRVLAAEAIKQHLDRDPAAQRRIAAARDRALEDIMVESEVGKAVTPQAEAALYQDFLKNRTPAEEIHLRQIVVASPADADAVKKALAGGAPFEAVAMERSTDAETRFKGGDLGEATTDTLPQSVAEAVRGATTGQVVGPVKVDTGWAVLRVEERKPEPAQSLDAVRPQLIRFITYDRIKDLVLRLRAKSKVEVLIAPPPAVPGSPTEPASAPPANAASPPPATLPPPPGGSRP